MVKKTLALLVLFFLVGCSAPSTAASVPATQQIPAGSTDTPAAPPAPATDTPVAPTAASGDAPYLPNPAWQPGALNPDVTQGSIQTTICVSGYTSKIRPPVSYTDKLKVQQIQQYGYTDTNPADYEEDHLISLEIGGDPKDPKNLWPQPRHATPYNASTKDTLENTLKQNGMFRSTFTRHGSASDCDRLGCRLSPIRRSIHHRRDSGTY